MSTTITRPPIGYRHACDLHGDPEDTSSGRTYVYGVDIVSLLAMTDDQWWLAYHLASHVLQGTDTDAMCNYVLRYGLPPRVVAEVTRDTHIAALVVHMQCGSATNLTDHE